MRIIDFEVAAGVQQAHEVKQAVVIALFSGGDWRLPQHLDEKYSYFGVGGKRGTGSHCRQADKPITNHSSPSEAGLTSDFSPSVVQCQAKYPC